MNNLKGILLKTEAIEMAHFINKSFALHEMFQPNASKFAIFYV